MWTILFWVVFSVGAVFIVGIASVLIIDAVTPNHYRGMSSYRRDTPKGT